jgi:iron complex outermembrane recepter protein
MNVIAVGSGSTTISGIGTENGAKGINMTAFRNTLGSLAIALATLWFDACPASELEAGSATPSTDEAMSGATQPAGSKTSTGDVLEEVTVTATRRSESQLDVPMTMSVIGAAALQAQEIKTFNDFATEVPNLSFNYGTPNGGWGGNTDDRGVSIRGIQGGDTTGFYIDDLPIPTSMTPRVLDLERIEVLKGPQGTLYGARSMGGTVRMITGEPDLSNFSGFALAQGTSIDGGGNGYETYGILNVPIINDTLAIRLTPYRGQDGGYINRVWPTTPGSTVLDEDKNTAETEYEGVMTSLLWKPTNELRIRPTLIYQLSTTNGLPLGDYSAENLTNFRNFDIAEGITDRFSIEGITIDYTSPIGTITSATDYLNRRTDDREDVSEFTAYAFGTPLLASPINQATTTHIFNQELRFVSNWEFPVQLTAGVFYNSQTGSLDNRQPIAAFLPIFGTDMAEAVHNRTSAEERALFGELTYKFTSEWSATLGMRYSQDRSDATLYAWGVAFGPPTEAQAVITPTSERDDVFTPKFLLKYEPNSNLNIYADAAKGFRPGSGEVAPPLALCASQYQDFHLTPAEVSSYRPDSLWSYELGAKMRTDDRRFSINPAVYWIDWTDVRQFLPLSCGFAAILNSGKARSRGAEFDFSAVPIEHLTLNGGIGYDDAKIVEPGQFVPYPAAGSPIQQVAPWTGNFSAQYDLWIASNVKMSMRGDYSYTDHSYSETTSPQFPLVRPSYSLVNLRTALDVKSSEFALFVKNVGDTHPNYGEQYSIAGFVPGRLRWTTGVPRTYGIEFSQKF